MKTVGIGWDIELSHGATVGANKDDLRRRYTQPYDDCCFSDSFFVVPCVALVDTGGFKIGALRILLSENTFAGHWETVVDCMENIEKHQQ